MMKEICVVHLVRAQNRIEPLARFIESYRHNSGAVDHDLLVVFKGFKSMHEKAEHLKLLAPFRYHAIDVTDAGFDITAYFSAAKQNAGKYLYFCFLNSFSVIQDREWLSKLYTQIVRPGIGLVGATGSWQSHWGKGGVLRLLSGTGMAVVRNFRAYCDRPILQRLVLSAAAGYQHVPFILDMDPFPNYHLRTNAFMIAGELVDKIVVPEMKSKMDAYRFESGKNGLTKQLLKLEKVILVVGKDGEGYEMPRWNESRTFWRAEQENLLVADNQTRYYQDGGVDRRKYLSSVAWDE